MNSAPWEVLGTLFVWFLFCLCALLVVAAACVVLTFAGYAVAGFVGAAKKRAKK